MNRKTIILSVILTIAGFFILLFGLAIIVPTEKPSKGLEWDSSGGWVKDQGIGSIYKIIPDPLDDNNLFLATDKGLYSYNFVNKEGELICNYNIKDFVFDKEDPNKISATYENQLLITENRKDWDTKYIFDKDIKRILIDKDNKSKIYITPEKQFFGEEKVIYISNNSGNNFECSPFKKILADNVSETIDVTYEELTQDPKSGSIYVTCIYNAIYNFNGEIIENKLGALCRSDDGGINWEKFPTGPLTQIQFFHDDKLYIDYQNMLFGCNKYKYDMIWASFDKGKTWLTSIV